MADTPALNPSPLDALPRARMRPEAKLLFLTAWDREEAPGDGAALDAAIVQTARSVRDWRIFLALAELERATSVAWGRLHALGAAPAGEHAKHMQHLAMIAGFRAQHLEQRLRETVEAFAREGIDVVLLKGAALAATVYRSFIERPMGDLDLLVHKDVAERAHEIARECGWRWDAETFSPARYVGHHHLPPLDDGAGTGVRLEIHVGLAIAGQPFAISRDELRAHSRPVTIGNAAAQSPSVEYLLLHQAIHFAWSHIMSFGAWRMARDVQLIARQGTLDWDFFLDLARRHRAESCVYWTFKLAQVLGGARIPQRVLSATKPPLGAFKHRILERHFMYHALPVESDWPSERLREWLWASAIQPERSGHGRSRPWAYELMNSDVMPSTMRERRDPESTRLILDPRRRLSAWARYVRSLG
ncbi:MAG: nucleotidyltransferase family protein [Gemmatimonadaceae bacterium]